MSFPFWALPAVLWAAFWPALVWRDVIDNYLDRWDLLTLAGIIFGPLLFSAFGRFLCHDHPVPRFARPAALGDLPLVRRLALPAHPVARVLRPLPARPVARCGRAARRRSRRAGGHPSRRRLARAVRPAAPFPWLTPDGRPWLASRPRAEGRAAPALTGPRRGTLIRARRTATARATRLVAQLCGAGPLARAALWALARPSSW